MQLSRMSLVSAGTWSALGFYHYQLQHSTVKCLTERIPTLTKKWSQSPTQMLLLLTKKAMRRQQRCFTPASVAILNEQAPFGIA